MASSLLNAEERPDFMSAEYQESLRLHRQSDSVKLFENGFEMLMDENDCSETVRDQHHDEVARHGVDFPQFSLRIRRWEHQQQNDIVDSFANRMPLTLEPRYSDTLVAGIDNDYTMDLDEDETTKAKAPTSFLDLPRELRQAIIHYSHDREPEPVIIDHWHDAYKYTDWANVLRKVHPVVEEDVNYVEEMWNKRAVVLPFLYAPTWVPRPRQYGHEKSVVEPWEMVMLAEDEERETARLERVRDKLFGKKYIGPS